MAGPSKEDRLLLALEAFQKDKNLKTFTAPKLYKVSETTLRCRRNGRPARRDTTPNSRRLTNSEEISIV
jgi:hypothetical protein